LAWPRTCSPGSRRSLSIQTNRPAITCTNANRNAIDDGPPADPIAGVIDRLALTAALRMLPLHERRIVLLSF